VRPQLPARPGAALARYGADRPEAWVYAASAACWAALVLMPIGAAATAFCLGGGDRLAAFSFVAGATFAGFEWPLAAWHWLLMIGAMMLPMAAMAARHVAFRSFPERRGRAVATFLLGYAAIWCAAAPLYLLAGLAVHAAAGDALLVPLAAALVLAAAWQGTAGKQQALRLCHRTVPLPPSGWRADRACLAYGLAHGRYCLRSCWALMLVPTAGGHYPALMLLAGAVGFAERAGPAGRQEPTAGALAAAGLACLALWMTGLAP
jgi:predicted metal-binding membrane protein